MAPKVSRVARQVAAGLPQQSGDRREMLGEFSGLLRRQRKAPAPELDSAGGERTFTSRLIALVGDHADVEGRIPFPGAQDPVIEIEAVHLGAHCVVVRLLRDGPVSRVDRGEPLLVSSKRPLLRRHRRGRVVRDAVDELRLLELAPVGEQRDQISVLHRTSQRRARAGARTEDREQDSVKQRSRSASVAKSSHSFRTAFMSRAGRHFAPSRPRRRASARSRARRPPAAARRRGCRLRRRASGSRAAAHRAR